MLTRRNILNLFLLALLVVILAILPNHVSRYYVSLMVSIFMYLILAISWAFFSGTTGYISLSTAAFFGIGIYLMAILGKSLSVPVVFLIALVAGFVIAIFVGMSTLRFRGIYFVIFTFGLSELLRQLFKWYEVNITMTVGRHITWVAYGSTNVYYYLLVLCIIIVFINWFIYTRSPLGYALRAIGQNEQAANSSGINTTFTKIFAFALSSSFMTLTGAILALRWSYIDPHIAFNPNISFMVAIMALLGGVGIHYGPILGVIPLVLLSEILSTRYPHYFMIMLGVVFILVIYFFENGVAGVKESGRKKYLQLMQKRKGVVDHAQR